MYLKQFLKTAAGHTFFYIIKTKPLMKMSGSLKFSLFKIIVLELCLFWLYAHQVTLSNPPCTLIMNGMFANYLRTMYWSVFGLKEWVRINILKYVIFSGKTQISKPMDVPYIHVYVWLKDDKHVIWMRIWLILKNIFIKL
jgi:hypothetical protein